MTDGIMSMVLDQMKKKGTTKRSIYNLLEISPTTLDNYFSLKYPITLSHFLKICELLNLNPSFFFNDEATIVNDITVQYATGKKVKQNQTTGDTIVNNSNEVLRVENEGLKKEIALLKELLEVYKARA